MIENGRILRGVYQIIGEIGRGGTGIIYLAEHLNLCKKVIVKKVKDNFVGQINGRAEVDILKRLHHTYLPQVYDFLVIDNSIYTVMEYIEGRDLQYYFDIHYHFSEELLRKWLLQLTEVLQYLHSQQPPILHSDIKPGNIMITRTGDVCLIDFNISLDGEVTKDIQGLSPWYAAPEQYERAQNILYGRQDRIVLDGKMDIYSLGAVFYHMMTGCFPKPTEDQSQVLMYMDIPYSDSLKVVVARMIKPDPAKRYSSAEKLYATLQDISKADPVYRRYGLAQGGVFVTWILCVIVGILCIYYGNWKYTVEKWQKAYQELTVAAECEDTVEIAARSTEILNSVTYRSYLEKNEDKKAEVLNILGDSYFGQGKYEEAASWYREAWDLDKAESKYCENYIIALIRSEQTERAKEVVSSADGKNTLTVQKRTLIELEMVWASGEVGESGEELKRLEETGILQKDSALAENAYLLLADFYCENQRYQEAVTVLERALKTGGGKNTRRQLGEVAFQAAEGSGQSTYRNSYLSKALECYQVLNHDRNPSYEDGLNLALIERAMGDYEGSNQTFKEMLLKYSDKYVLPMWMCYNYLDIAKQSGDWGKIEGDLHFRYQDCKHIYASYGTRDENMERLEEIMDKLGV